ncbi:MAG: hypothetical protein ACR2PL_05315 [Dehalococcoidia bacterium]
MEERFDALAKVLAMGVTRRQVLGRMSRGGVGGMLLAVLGVTMTQRSVRAQEKTEDLPNCLYDFEATVRQGPSAGLALRGSLALVEDTSRDLGSVVGYLIPNGGNVTASDIVPVTGRVDGLALILQFALANGSTMTGTGSMDNTIDACRGKMRGDLTGPQLADTGDWAGGADRASCISRGVHNCVASGGANGSAVCAVGAVATCVATT